MRLGDLDALKEEVKTIFCPDGYKIMMLERIDNAPLVKAFTEEDMAGAYNEGYMCGSKEAENARPQGEWKYHKGDRLFLPYMECSNCKVQDSLGKLTKKEYREVNHFCFNCGAKMKGGVEWNLTNK